MDINSLLMASTSSVELPNLSAVKASDAPLANFEKILQQHLPELSTQSDPTELAGLLQLGSPQLITLLPADHTLALPALEIPVETPNANLLEPQSLPLAPDVNSNVEATTVEALAADPDVSETPVHAKEAAAEVEIAEVNPAQLIGLSVSVVEVRPYESNAERTQAKVSGDLHGQAGHDRVAFPVQPGSRSSEGAAARSTSADDLKTVAADTGAPIVVGGESSSDLVRVATHQDTVGDQVHTFQLESPDRDGAVDAPRSSGAEQPSATTLRPAEPERTAFAPVVVSVDRQSHAPLLTTERTPIIVRDAAPDSFVPLPASSLSRDVSVVGTITSDADPTLAQDAALTGEVASTESGRPITESPLNARPVEPPSGHPTLGGTSAAASTTDVRSVARSRQGDVTTEEVPQSNDASAVELSHAEAAIGSRAAADPSDPVLLPIQPERPTELNRRETFHAPTVEVTNQPPSTRPATDTELALELPGLNPVPRPAGGADRATTSNIVQPQTSAQREAVDILPFSTPISTPHAPPSAEAVVESLPADASLPSIDPIIIEIQEKTKSPADSTGSANDPPEVTPRPATSSDVVALEEIDLDAELPELRLVSEHRAPVSQPFVAPTPTVEPVVDGVASAEPSFNADVVASLATASVVDIDGAAPAVDLQQSPLSHAPRSLEQGGHPMRSAAAAVEVADAEFGEWLNARVREQPSGGTWELRLDPPGMEVRVVLNETDDRWSASFYASDAAGVAHLETRIEDLRQSLETAGINVDSLEVEQDAGQPSNFQRERTEEQRQESPRSPRLGDHQEHNGETDEQSSQSSTNHRIDIVA